MPVTVNGVELRDADIERELDHHHDAANPARLATISAILRQLVRAEADRIGLAAEGLDDDALAQALLAHEAGTPEPDEASCRRHYDSRPGRFREGDWVEADHILFQVTPRVPLDALREIAAQTLALVRGDPCTFPEHARALSNCPSGANGGRLGRVFRGETAPEFERALFAAQQTACCRSWWKPASACISCASWNAAPARACPSMRCAATLPAPWPAPRATVPGSSTPAC